MSKESITDKIKAIYYDQICYFFAKQWLNKNFGKKEYWGSEIEDLLK